MDIPNFSDLTEHVNLEGDKVKLDEIFRQHKRNYPRKEKKWELNIQIMA